MILVIVLVTIFSFVPVESVDTDATASQWMKNVDDDTRLTEMSIPGSHDSGAMHSIGDVAGKCQDLSINNQLDIGIRFFDIRLKLKNNEFVVVHGPVEQNLEFETVLTDFVSFIEENNSETLIISIKKEAESSNSTLTFDEALIQQLTTYDDVVVFDDTLPETLGEARGKIYIISRYEDSTIGIPAYEGWEDSTSFVLNDFYVQDNYKISDVNDKIEDIKKTFTYSSSNVDKLSLNFASCYLSNGFPPSYAGTTAKQINVWLMEHLDEYDGSLGIVICDFVTSDLAEKIYERN